MERMILVSPHFSAKSLLSIGIGGSKVAGIPNVKDSKRKTFNKRHKSVQPGVKYVPMGKATEIQKYNLQLQRFKQTQALMAQYKRIVE